MSIMCRETLTREKQNQRDPAEITEYTLYTLYVCDFYK